MININDPEHFLQVFNFAAANGCADKLALALSYLATYGDGDNWCELYYDSAPYSFAFWMCHPDRTRWFNGGLIYSGPNQPLDGSGPAFTVSLNRTGHEHNWSVNT